MDKQSQAANASGQAATKDRPNGQAEGQDQPGGQAEGQDLPGGQATKPTDIPPAGWKQIALRGWRESKRDNVPMLAAGVTYFGFIALFPAMIALLTIYGLVTDPQQAVDQVNSFATALPDDARNLLASQLQSVAGASQGGLTFSLIASLLGALWGASAGVMNLMKAVNIAYDEEETRGFVKLRAVALAMTLGSILFFGLSLALVAIVPPLIDGLGLGVAGTIAAQVVRWGLLLVLVVAALALVYRFAPDRDAPKLKWVSVGALVATVVWVIVSLGFSFYVNNFGSYNKTYGALAGVVVLMLWLYFTAYVVLLGAEINAESEHQTMRDTTKGDEVPMGDRRATVADTYPPDPTGERTGTDVRAEQRSG